MRWWRHSPGMTELSVMKSGQFVSLPGVLAPVLVLKRHSVAEESLDWIASADFGRSVPSTGVAVSAVVAAVVWSAGLELEIDLEILCIETEWVRKLVLPSAGH